jgi:putative transposase
VNFERIEAVAEEYPASVVCEVLGVSRSGLYAYRARTRRPLTPRERENTKLDHTIATVFDEGRRSYGRPRMQRALRARGIRIGDNRLRKKMRQMGLVAKPKRRFRKTTDSDHDSPIAPNLLEQDFYAKAPNRVWCSDITYVRTWAGWVYVCVIIDLFSRKVVGWAAADHLRAELVTDAFDMAIGRRLVEPGLIFNARASRPEGSRSAKEERRGG